MSERKKAKVTDNTIRKPNLTSNDNIAEIGTKDDGFCRHPPRLGLAYPAEPNPLAKAMLLAVPIIL